MPSAQVLNQGYLSVSEENVNQNIIENWQRSAKGLPKAMPQLHSEIPVPDLSGQVYRPIEITMPSTWVISNALLATFKKKKKKKEKGM